MKTLLRILLPAIAVFAGVLGLFRTGVARADATEPQPGIVTGAVYTPMEKDGVLTWYARWMVAPEVYTARTDAPPTIRFAAPLPPGAALAVVDHDAMLGPSVEPIVDGGRIVGVRVLRMPLPTGESLGNAAVRARITQPAPKPGERIAFAAPIADGRVLQIIDGIVDGGPRVDVDGDDILERHIGWVGPRGVTKQDRFAAQAAARFFVPGVRGNTIFVRGDDVRALGGLRGTIATPISRATMIAIGGAFAAIVAALLYALRKLRHAASVERADAILRFEIEGMRG
jgi:hypothetical protein